MAGGGIHFADEIYKNKKDLVQVYLGVIQNRSIEIDGYKWPIDTLIVATSNNSEFNRFLSEKEEAPIVDRCRICYVSHNTNYKLQKDLTLAHQSGVENLLVFTEDYRISGDSLQETMFFHVDSGKLGSVLDHIREGRTVEGDELPNPVDFTLGSGVESLWGRSIPKKGMSEMETMRELGAGYFLTTPIFDIDQFQKFVGQVDTFAVPIIAEVLLLRNPAMARFINRHFKSGLVPEWVVEKLDKAADKKRASIELFADLVKGLKELCQGVHIITMGGEDRLQPYLDAADLR